MRKIFLMLILLLPQVNYSQIIYRAGYFAEFDTTYACTAYVSWTLTPQRVSHNCKRIKFIADTLYGKYVITPSDYINCGYDRGHLSNSADNQISHEYLIDSYKMLNIVPQNPKLNRGVWKSLEDSCRLWALSNDSIIIIAGCIFNNNAEKVNNKITVPYYIYKIIVFYPSEVHLYFLFKNMAANIYSKNIWDYRTTEDKLLRYLNTENIFPPIN